MRKEIRKVELYEYITDGEADVPTGYVLVIPASEMYEGYLVPECLLGLTLPPMKA